jgi:hypothetical protein
VVVVGAGASTLVDALVGDGYDHITCTDIAQASLAQLANRLGSAKDSVTMVCTNVLDLEVAAPVKLWHDRAVFHFLTDPSEQARYVEVAARAIEDQGNLILATFAPDGPTHCSGLPVQRWSPTELAHTFSPHFDLLDSFVHTHVTPWASEQQFTYVVLRRRSSLVESTARPTAG